MRRRALQLEGIAWAEARGGEKAGKREGGGGGGERELYHLALPPAADENVL